MNTTQPTKNSADKGIRFATEAQAIIFERAIRKASILAAPKRTGVEVLFQFCSWKLVDLVLAELACGSYSWTVR